MFAMNITLLLCTFVFLQLFRWDHAGRVCSGDYIEEGQKESKCQDPGSNYLCEEGAFIEGVIIGFYIVIFFGMVSVCCVAILMA